jgi:hypothetical protein
MVLIHGIVWKIFNVAHVLKRSRRPFKDIKSVVIDLVSWFQFFVLQWLRLWRMMMAKN